MISSPVAIDADGDLSDAPLQATLTDVNGEYQFTDLGPLPAGSSYVVVEVQQPGWVQTAPPDGAADTIELPSGLRGYVIPAVSGIAVTTGSGQGVSISGSGTVRLNALNNSTTATVSYVDQAGNSGSISTFLAQFNVTFTGGPGTPMMPMTVLNSSRSWGAPLLSTVRAAHPTPAHETHTVSGPSSAARATAAFTSASAVTSACA